MSGNRTHTHLLLAPIQPRVCMSYVATVLHFSAFHSDLVRLSDCLTNCVASVSRLPNKLHRMRQKPTVHNVYNVYNVSIFWSCQSATDILKHVMKLNLSENVQWVFKNANKHNEKQRNSTVTVMAEKTVFNKRFLGFRFLGFMVFRFLICTKTEHESTTQKQMVYLNTVS